MFSKSRSIIAAAAVFAIAGGSVLGVTSAQAATDSDPVSAVTQPGQPGDAPTPDAVQVRKGENGELIVEVIDPDSAPTDGWAPVTSVTGKPATGKRAAAKSGDSVDLESTTPGSGDAPNPEAVSVRKGENGDLFIEVIDKDSAPIDGWAPTTPAAGKRGTTGK